MTREQIIDEAVRQSIIRHSVRVTWLCAVHGYSWGRCVKEIARDIAWDLRAGDPSWLRIIRAEFRRIIESEAGAQSGGAR